MIRKTLKTIALKLAMVSAGAVPALALVAGIAASAPAQAQESSHETAGVKVGVLTCETDGGWGLIIGSSRVVDCEYQPTAASVEHYRGKLGKLGMDIGYKGPGVMVWTVVAPTSDTAPGALAGNYGGVTAGASAGIGLSANAMIGGSDKQVALQPLSVEGNVGLNASAGLSGLSLTYVGGF